MFTYNTSMCLYVAKMSVRLVRPTIFHRIFLTDSFKMFFSLSSITIKMCLFTSYNVYVFRNKIKCLGVNIEMNYIEHVFLHEAEIFKLLD